MYLILRTDSFAKLFFILTSTGLLLYIILAFYTYHTAFLNVSYLRKYHSRRGISNTSQKVEEIEKIKYILIWKTNNKTSDYGNGMYPFIDRKCPSSNCYLTTDQNLLHEDYRNFDAIVFDVEDMKDWRQKHLPLRRLQTQKYIFYSTLPSSDIAICNVITDEYFNWTCTFRLDSDIVIPFFHVINTEGKIVTPSNNVVWERDVMQLSKAEKDSLRNKTKAMVWINNRCDSNSNNVIAFAEALQKKFAENSLDFDIYGCGFKNCSNKNCAKLIHKYYFYFAVEDSNDEDYINKTIVKAYHSFAIPVVKGGADYKKFLPEASYINIGQGSIDKIVATVDYIIRNPTVYYNFHRWRKHYFIREANPFYGYCKICEYLNTKEKCNTPSIKTGFRKWWYKRPLYERCFPRSTENITDITSYTNDKRKYADVKIV